MTLSRRQFLQGTAACGAAFGFLPRIAYGATDAPATGDTLVLIVLRGGADGLSALVPVGEAGLYHDPRGGAAIPENRVLPIDARFGLHPALAPLHELHQDGVVAFVPATGSTDSSRSHFDQQAILERGSTASVPGDIGWLARHLMAREADPLQAFAGSHQLPMVLHGAPASIASPSVSRLTDRLRRTADLERGGDTLRRISGDGRLGEAAASSTAAATALLDAPPVTDAPDAYPQDPTLAPLHDVAHLLNHGLNIDAVVIDVGGWDLHAGMGDTDGGPMQARLTALGQALAAFHGETAALARPVTTVVISEFGRTVALNGSGGTDHGRGGLVVAMGRGVKGGVYGPWPGLDASALDDGALPAATDFRDVLAEVVLVRLGNPDLATVFPGHQPHPLGLTLT